MEVGRDRKSKIIVGQSAYLYIARVHLLELFPPTQPLVAVQLATSQAECSDSKLLRGEMT